MDSKSIRYKNTRLLVDSVGGVSNFADKIGKGQSQTSQFAGTNPIKGIGNKVAREIEEAFEKPYGWLDISHLNVEESTCLQEQIISTNETSSSLRNSSLDRLIKQLESLDAKKQLSNELLKTLSSMIEIATNSKIINKEDQ